MGDGWRWVGLLLLSACVACGSSDETGSEQPAFPEPTDPLGRGAFQVGVTTWTLNDSSRLGEDGEPRKLKVEIWYPAIDAAAELPRDEYDLLEEAPPDIAATLQDVTTTSVAQDAARDAELLTTFAPYPLVVFSHGNGGLRFQNFTICSHLASHGFVVVAPDHTGDTTWEAINGSLSVGKVLESFPERALDLPFVAEQLVATDGPLEGAAEADNWAMMGHSFGASMSLALTEEHNGVEPDSRFRAAVPMTPASSILPLFGYGVEKSRVPTLIFGARRDGTLDFENEQVTAYEGIPTDKAFAAVREAGHFSYTDLCRPELQDLAQALGEDVGDILGDGCGSDFIEPESMLIIQRYLVTTFLDAELRQGAGSRAALGREALPVEVVEPIEYQTSGY